MPTRCNRCFFYCRSYCLLKMFQAPLCPSSGAREYCTVGWCLWYLVLWFSGCRYGVELRVVGPVCGLHLVGILFPHINEDARSKSLQIKIYIKTAPTCFGAVTPSSGSALISCLLKLQLLNSPLKYIGVYVCMYVSVCLYNCNFSKHELMRSLTMV